MKHGLLLMLLCAYSEMYAAFEHLIQGASSIAMGGASVAVRGNPWSSFSNPGGLTTIDERVLSLCYAPQPFGLRELARGSFSYVEPTTIGTIAASASRFGFDLYREIDLNISYGTTINDLLSVGAGIHYYHLSIERYGSTQTLGVDLGFVAQLSDQVRWGCVAYNVNGPTIGNEKEKLPQVFTTGVAYAPIPDATIVADLEKDIRYPLELHAGVQYMLLELLALRAGTTSDPSMLSAGVGIHYSFIQLDYAFTNHAELGPTHQFSLSLFPESFEMMVLYISAFLSLVNGTQPPDSVESSADSLSTERETESATEDNLFDQFQNESDNLQVLDDLVWRREHPFDLNTVGAEELETIPGVTPGEASALIAYRNTIKDFVSVKQIRRIDGGDDLLDKLAPYVMVKINRDDQHVQLRSRTTRDLQPRKGDLDSTFLGSSPKTYSRLIIAGGDFQAGALFEKDGGEQFSNGFVSGYVAVKDVGIVQQVIVGDFNVDAGQGLVMWRGSAFGKGGEAVGVAKSGLGVQPYRSTDEFNFLRGAAASTSIELGTGKVDATVFFSGRLLDGNLDTSEGVSSFYEAGLFRTLSELGKRKAVSERLIGGRIEFASTDRWRIGSTAYHTTFDKPVIADAAFDFAGREVSIAGVDATASLGRLSAFGEIARSSDKAFAGMAGAIVNVGAGSNVALVYREYGAAFNNFHATGFGERSETKNERGLYVGFDLRVLTWLKLSGYVDQFRFPWRTFSNALPTTGHEILAQAEAAVAPKLGLALRFTHKSTEETAADVDPFGRETRPIVDRSQQKYRLTATYKATPRVRLKGRLEFTEVRFSLLNTRERGYMLYEDVWWSLPRTLTIEGRLAFFQTDSYDSRIYEYENDLRGVFSNPALYGKGRRWYLMIRYNAAPMITLGLKYSETQKEGVTSLGSGSTEVIGDIDNRLSVQLDIRW